MGRRPSKPLKRRAGSRPERRTVVIFTEGQKSEPQYLQAIRRLPHVAANKAVRIEIASDHVVPMPLVELAAERITDPEVDHCWCVFDVEAPVAHPNVVEALNLAERAGVQLAISNPCFELWLILHFQDHSAYLETRAADALSRSLDGRAGKNIDGSVYLPRRGEAAQRAVQLTHRHAKNGAKFPFDNPSTTVHELLAFLESL